MYHTSKCRDTLTFLPREGRCPVSSGGKTHDNKRCVRESIRVRPRPSPNVQTQDERRPSCETVGGKQMQGGGLRQAGEVRVQGQQEPGLLHEAQVSQAAGRSRGGQKERKRERDV